MSTQSTPAAHVWTYTVTRKQIILKWTDGIEARKRFYPRTAEGIAAFDRKVAELERHNSYTHIGHAEYTFGG